MRTTIRGAFLLLAVLPWTCRTEASTVRIAAAESSDDNVEVPEADDGAISDGKVTEAQGGSGVSGVGRRLQDEQIDDVGERVMQGNEFRSLRRRVLENPDAKDADKGFLQQAMQWIDEQISSVFNAIGEFLAGLFRSSGSSAPPPPAPSVGGDMSFLQSLLSGVWRIMVFLILAALLVIVAMLISAVVKSAEKRRSRLLNPGIDGEEDLRDLSVPPGELPASTYESRAEQYAREGNYRAAIRELLLGAMSWIERSGKIRYRRGLTNRDYVRAVWRNRPTRDAFALVAVEFERVYFGRRDATEQRFTKCLITFRGAFCEEEPVAAI